MNTRLAPWLGLSLVSLFLASCTSEAANTEGGGGEHGHEHVEFEDAPSLHSWYVLKGLKNPSSVSMSPDGDLTVCDSGNGRVLVLNGVDGSKTAKRVIDGFETEFWKVGGEGEPDRFALGPLSAIWAGQTLVVSDSGHPDGQDRLAMFDATTNSVADARTTNSIPPTSDDPADKGEGNFVGLAVADGDKVWVCGQGADAKSWLCRADIATGELAGFLSADELGIETNSPMDSLQWDAKTVLVLYSGAGGEEDGLLVAFDIEEKAVAAQWNLPGLIDPMGMARRPGTDELVIVDNNWALTTVNRGALARVKLPEAGGEADVQIVTRGLLGPVSVCISEETLYVTQLGKEFDSDEGAVIAIEGVFADQ